MSTADRNYTNVEQSGIDSKAERVGDITGEPPINEAMDRNKASKLANLLEGLEFPATKEKIRNHLNASSAGLVKKAESEKPYARDSGLNRANSERVGESERQDPYSSRERISGASSRDVSPNTPKGEDV